MVPVTNNRHSREGGNPWKSMLACTLWIPDDNVLLRKTSGMTREKKGRKFYHVRQKETRDAKI
jgi:hypothetical protein